MAPVRSIDGLSWRWQMFAGRWTLITDGGGALVILSPSRGGTIQTRDRETGLLRNIADTDQVAKMIAAAPDVTRHAQSLINGIDIGLVRIDTDADEALANTMNGLRAALAKGRP